MRARRLLLLSALFLIALISLSCEFIIGPSSAQSQTTSESAKPDLEATAQMLSLQMAGTAQAQMASNPPPAPTQQVVPPTLTPQPTQTQETPPQPPAETELIKDLKINRNVFYCIKSDGPTTVTFTVEMTDIDRGLAIFWRLVEKGSEKTSEWQNVSMTRKTATARTFTFDANAWDGTNNFYYPPLFGESWFQFQLISGDAKYRTSIYRDDITFFPCAQ